jgi:tRNA A-37 threonylcarbamoyl transferase component Bud32/tetratricopeptide (TPR) repeat protein
MAESRTNGGGSRTTPSVHPPSDRPSTHESDGADGAKPTATSIDALKKGDTLGRYLVLEQLGAGAMGVVYAAYDPELDRKIAIKVLRPHEGKGDRTRRQERLVREAKAMAKLSHPNVGSIYDVGVHGDQVFLAMEFLSGGTLRDWITAKKRPWREAVKMFIEVGKGLAGAHAEGLIHRDFKPDNVLLDKNGVPKVVDFGLVRLNSAALDQSSTGSVDSTAEEDEVALPLAETAEAALTRTGALTGTPAYMAPEQFLGKAIDTRTDQFAFCIALYEAVHGERPFAGNTVIAIAETVTSARIKAPPKDAHVPARIRRILLRGLSVDPAKRFSSMETLTAALANDPAKRTRKWALIGTTVATMVSLLVVATRSGSKPQTMCTGAGQRLAGIWDPGAGPSQRKGAIREAFARTGKSYAAQAYSSVARLFDQYAERWTGMYTDACQATHVRGEQSAEVLDLRMACLNERLGNARALSDVFAGADGKVVENAVSAAAALPSLDRCADIPLLRAVVKPPEDPSTRRRVEDLRAELAQLGALRDSGQCARAVPKATMLIARVREVGYQPLLADALYQAARIGSNCGDVPGMLQRFREAHAVASASHSDDIAAQASSLIPPFAINRLGQTVVAQEWLVVARGDVARLGHETLADAMLAQADGMLALSEHAYDRALAAADRSINITRRLLGPDDPLTIQWEANKADWLQAAGRLDEAIKSNIEAREHLERVLGSEHPQVAYLRINEGEMLNVLGRHAAAEESYRTATKLFRQSGADPDVLAWSLTGLGLALLDQEKSAEAVPLLEEALSIRVGGRASAAQLGETRFALARALWSRPAGRRRAMMLSASARRDYGDDATALAAIDAWLRRARTERI